MFIHSVHCDMRLVVVGIGVRMLDTSTVTRQCVQIGALQHAMMAWSLCAPACLAPSRHHSIITYACYIGTCCDWLLAGVPVEVRDKYFAQAAAASGGVAATSALVASHSSVNSAVSDVNRTYAMMRAEEQMEQGGVVPYSGAAAMYPQAHEQVRNLLQRCKEETKTMLSGNLRARFRLAWLAARAGQAAYRLVLTPQPCPYPLPRTSQLLRLGRNKPYYERNMAKLCSFFAKGECNRGDECPFRHIMPRDKDDPLAKQNIKDRYFGTDDPVAAKMMGRLNGTDEDGDGSGAGRGGGSGHFSNRMPEPPSDPTVTTVWVAGLDERVTEEDLRCVSLSCCNRTG